MGLLAEGYKTQARSAMLCSESHCLPRLPLPLPCRHAETVSALKPSPRLAGPQQPVVPLVARTTSSR